MTCSEEQYVGDSVQGKRTKARGQLLETLLSFRQNMAVSHFLESREKRYLIFSWKDTSVESGGEDPIEKSFLPFTEFSDATYSSDNVQLYDYGFYFREIRYPDVLRWG
jgi:hypothetical protein